MKKIFQVIGLISLTCFSFFVTEKTATVVNDMDEIMIEIKNEKDKFTTEPINAVIEGNTIIPGVSGRKVNVNKSYKLMKSNGYYSENLFVYDYTKPKISLNDNMDKYIIKGNPNKRMISLIFVVNGNDNITDILNIVNNFNIKSTFFVDQAWFENNNNLTSEMSSKGHSIGVFLNDYKDSSFEWMDMIIKKINKQNTSFCYNTIDNNENINACKLKGNYTIRPILISDNTPLMDVKSKLESGSLLSFKVNSQVKKELSTIIIYIKSKGYNIASLDENVLE